jgi:hypothetical protein
VKDVDIIGKQKKMKRSLRIVHYVKVKKYTKQLGTKGSQKNQGLNLEDRIRFKEKQNP